MQVQMIAIRPFSYRTRRLKPGDSFPVKNATMAKLLVAAKRAELDTNPNERVALDDLRDKAGMKPLSKDSEEIGALRAAYTKKFGKRPFNGWDAAALKAKIGEG